MTNWLLRLLLLIKWGGGGGGIPLCSAFIIHVFDYFTNFCVCSQPINIKTISLHLETVCMFSPFKKKLVCLFCCCSVGCFVGLGTILGCAWGCAIGPQQWGPEKSILPASSSTYIGTLLLGNLQTFLYFFNWFFYSVRVYRYCIFSHTPFSHTR